MLTDAVVRRLKPAEKGQKHADARGLYLYVSVSGAKSWRYDYRLNGVRKTLTLGLYPDVSLKRAREKLQAARTLVADGEDPSDAKRAATLKAKARDRFSDVADEWLKKQRGLSEITRRKKVWLLGMLKPKLGALSIGTIEPPLILTVIHAIERRGRHETAHRALHVCGQVFRYAVVTGRATRDQTADLRGALAPVVSESHAAITEPKPVGALLRAIDGLDGSLIVRTALALAPLVFVRPGELRTAEWADVDLEHRLWKIPAAKMKMRADHLVPLSKQAVALLEAVKPRTGSGRYVFPSARTSKRPMSNNTLNAALRRLGYGHDEMTAHGFRAMARTLLDERLRFPPDVIEVQLGHTVRGPLGSTYNRSQYLEARTALMQTWADELDRLRTLK